MTAKAIPVFSSQGGLDDHYPLALGLLQAHIARHARDRRRYKFFPYSLSTMEQFIAVGRTFGPGIWLLSDYLWSSPFNLALGARMKSIDSRNLFIHGGPSVPTYPDKAQEFLRTHTHVDIMVRGEGEETALEIFDRLSDLDLDDISAEGVLFERLKDVAGLTLSCDGNRTAFRTPDRPRITDLSRVPSAYLSGVFDRLPRLMLNFETNRGCPYSCSFCDWGSLTQQKIKLHDMAKVLDEIDWMGRSQISQVFCTDANFGIFERDVEIAEALVKCHQKYGFPRSAGTSFAKNATERVVEIVKIWKQGGLLTEGVLSLQTTDPATLKAIQRSNISTRRYEELLAAYREQGLPAATDLMFGLPGQTLASYKSDLQRSLDLDVVVQSYPTALLPNSPMADPEYQAEHKIRTNDQGFVVETTSFSEADWVRMVGIHTLYRNLEVLSFCRYVFRYWQWDHGVLISDFLHRLCLELWEVEPRLPFPDFFEILRPDKSFGNRKFSVATPSSIWIPFSIGCTQRPDEFYRAIVQVAERCFGIGVDPSLETVLMVNRALIPDPKAHYPLHLSLEHDFVAYFRDRRVGLQRRLADYGPAQFVVTDPVGLALRPPDRLPPPTSFRQPNYELHSPLKERAGHGLMPKKAE